MALERYWTAVSQPFSSDGTARGTFQVANFVGFFVKQTVTLRSNTQPPLFLQIKRIDSDSGTIYVGDPDKDIKARTDVSAYLVADVATVTAAEQSIPAIKPDDIYNAVYEREPVKALRFEVVDDEGVPIGKDNPLPVLFSATFPNTVEIASGDGSGFKMKVNPDGSINVDGLSSGFITTPTIANPVVAVANVEQSYTLPMGTVRYLLKSRTNIAKIQLAYVLGDSGLKYITIPRGCSYSEEGLNPAVFFTLYFQADGAGEVLEIVSWKS